MPRWIQAEQGSTEWLMSRVGNLTASRMADAMAVTKSGESEKRRRLKLEILAERLSGRATDCFVNDAMKHGMKYEAEARDRYEATSGQLVQLCGLAMHDTIAHLGASPDGLIGDDAIHEIKCPSLTTYLQYKLDDVVPTQYRPQMMLQMICTGRSYGVFTAYHPFLPEEINLFIKEYRPTQEELDATTAAAEKFLAEVNQMMEVITGKAPN